MRKGKFKRPQKNRQYNYYVDNPNLQELQFLDELEKTEEIQPSNETIALHSTSLFSSENNLQSTPNMPVEEQCEVDSKFPIDQYEEASSLIEGKGDPIH